MNLDNVEERIDDATDRPAMDDIDVTDDDLGFGLDDDYGFDDDLDGDADHEFDEDDLDTDLEDDEEDAEDEAEVETEDVEDESVRRKGSKRKKRELSPAEIKLVALKKENKALREKMRENQDKRKAETLAKKYVDEGYDEDTARRYANQDIDSDKLRREVALLRFENKNADVFERYPEALEDIDEIMHKAQAADMTAEQVCMALYGRPTYDQNALRAARGESIYDSGGNRGSGSALRSAGTERDGVSRKEQSMIRQMERLFNNGKPLSKEEKEIITQRMRKG